ncbi:MAG TPA: hypothetical protein VMK12_13085 [Anaeromyxobacteraceae bacterium]|nr:hypothetical protein [Anaeromyxobacteraceae bacterium]
MLRSIRLTSLVAVALLTSSLPLRHEAAGWRIGANAGVGSAFGQAYGYLGGTVGYELAFGLELDAMGSWWWGNTPGFGKVGPGLTWYLPIPLFRPYIGAYYAHWFVAGNVPDSDSVGGRVGVLLLSAGPTSLGVGAFYERRLSCSSDCDTWAPEINASITF